VKPAAKPAKPDSASPAVAVDENFGGDPSLPQRVFRRSTLKGF
jgi:hypothetical protein